MFEIGELTLVLSVYVHQIPNIRRRLIWITEHRNLLLRIHIFHHLKDFLTFTLISSLHPLLLDDTWNFLIKFLLNYFPLFIKTVNSFRKLSDVSIINLQILLKTTFFLFKLINLLWQFKGTKNLILFILNETYFFF